MNKKITIVIVTHNARTYLPDCLESVYRQDYPRELVKIVAVDNNSSDSTVGYLREEYPEVTVIANQQNLGFAAANNQGYQAAKKNQLDYLVLLNQDTIVEPGWLKQLVKMADSDRHIAAVQPKIMLHPQTELINSLGNSIHYLGFAFCDHYREPNPSTGTAPFALPYASGAACLLKMSALTKTGLFDDRLFMYHEDVDLGWRLRLAGYQIMLAPAAVVYHKYNYSKAKYKFYYMDRNRLVVLLENYRVATLLLLSPMLLLMELGIILFAAKNGWLKEKFRGYGWIAAHLPSILAQRIKVQFQLRQVPDRAIVRMFTARIKFQEIDNPLLRYLANPLMTVYWLAVKWLIFW